MFQKLDKEFSILYLLGVRQMKLILKGGQWGSQEASPVYQPGHPGDRLWEPWPAIPLRDDAHPDDHRQLGKEFPGNPKK